MSARALWVRWVLRASEWQRNVLVAAFALLGPEWAYAVSGLLGRGLYYLLPGLRTLCEGQCGAALGRRLPEASIRRIAAASWVHRVWNLTDLLLAERRLHPQTAARCGAVVPEPHLGELRSAQARGQPAILVSAYYGPYDLLPAILGCSGLRATAVYEPHANPAFDARRQRIRSRGGCELVPLAGALARLPEVLAAGGTVALVADHADERRGVPITFLGLPTTAFRSVGLLAWRYDADVVVAGVRRRGPFRFEIEVADIIRAPDWRDAADPVRYIVERYVRGLERIVLRDPAQYLWAYPRWGRALVQRILRAATPGREGA